MGIEAGVSRPAVTVSISSFVPKPHTPFQWEGMADREALARMIDYLSRECRRAKITFKWHHPAMSMIEGVLARGDRRLGRVIERVWRAGRKLEAWTDRFDERAWVDALAAEGLTIEEYAYRVRDPEETAAVGPRRSAGRDRLPPGGVPPVTRGSRHPPVQHR